MMKLKLVMLTAALGACTAGPGDGSPTVSNVPRIALNALSPAALAGSALTTAQLDATSAAAMGATADARVVLAYAAGCALADDQQVSYTAGGDTVTVSGAMGIAPAWTDRALTADEAAWVSACVFARVNLTSTVVSISARGASLGLDTSAGELADYQVEEGAFWGNAFVDLGALAAYACEGVDQAAADSYGDLPLRKCAQWDGVTDSNQTQCGFHYSGLCQDACATTGGYADCSFQGGTAQADVVTTFLYGTPP
jgi:hypothetical protein